MDSHLLIELTHMFYRVHSTIVNGERRLMKSPRKFCPLYLVREGWFGDLIQHLAHNIISHAFMRQAFVPSLVVAFFIVRERFARWSSWPSLITRILFIIGGDVRIWKGSFSLCMAQLLLQIVNLLLHSFGAVLPLKYLTANSAMTSACMCGMHTTLPIPVLLTISIKLQIKKIVLLLRICGLSLVHT